MGVSEGVSEEGFSLGDRELEEMEGDFCSGDMEDRGHGELEEGDVNEAPYILTSYLWRCWYQTAFTSPSSQEWSFVLLMQ